jgi:tetratricopeptide (TPR) repeat protein
MVGTLSPGEHAQLLQTVEMFELITQTQPNDYQSLEILKEAYSKLGREEDLIRTARRVAENYVQLGQLSSAIFEYESILQRHPNDAEALQALDRIENAASSLQAAPQAAPESEAQTPSAARAQTQASAPHAGNGQLDDGRQNMLKYFVESKVISQGDFDVCWTRPNHQPHGHIFEPFIQVLADRGTLPIERSLKILLEKSRLAFMPVDRYDTDMELARSFPADACRRWCVLPFDRMSKSVLVATANPFNRQACRELEAATNSRLIYYIAPPQDIIKGLKKVFR